ncbi:Pentatricopeptide repeat-containing protein [Nymphaea thermarum]|nr:Pentatricopeptide repeat-containing protein [Nymphaea thermarum]
MFNLMKDEEVSRERKIYNSVIYALARRGNNYLNDAMNIVRMMEQRKGEGEGPNVATYNSLIKALCKAKRVNDAWSVLNRMRLNHVSPSVRTYHPLLRRAVNAEEVFDLLNEMRRVGCVPVVDSYLMLIRKFCRWRQISIVWKLWDDMHKYGLSYDRSSYSILINGLFLNGFLEDAWRYCQEMKAKGFEPEPKMDEMLKAWVPRKAITNTFTTLGERKETTATTTGNNKSDNCSTATLRLS